jgi:hypothetical protein
VDLAEAARRLGVRLVQVPILLSHGHLDFCHQCGRKDRATVESIEVERQWRASATLGRRLGRVVRDLAPF